MRRRNRPWDKHCRSRYCNRRRIQPGKIRLVPPRLVRHIYRVRRGSLPRREQSPSFRYTLFVPSVSVIFRMAAT